MRKYITPIVILALTTALLISVAGCSTAKTTSPTTGTTTSGDTISISNFTFVPGTLTVSAGTTVTWTNNDSTAHIVASDTGVFVSGNLSQNAVFSYTFNNAGTYPYHCSIHTYMTGTIIVK